MDENQLAKNIVYYRKKKGLSQEKLSEYMGVSRQAVTKWENDISRPSSDNLIKLAQLFEISVDVLLDNEKQETVSIPAKAGKAPWFFIGISFVCIIVYVIISSLSGTFSMGTFICMFILCVPIQLFLHIYFSNAIGHDSFSGIAGFDDEIEYNIDEVKKMLVQLNLHIGRMSAVYVFLLCAVNCVDMQIKWLNGFLIMVYLLDLVITVEVTNYKMIDKIYCRDDDKKRARQAMPITVIYTLLLFAGMGITGFIFEVEGIENNTLPAMKTGGMLILGVFVATIGFVVENRKLKKWNPGDIKYKKSKVCMISFLLCAVLYGLMCIV